MRLSDISTFNSISLGNFNGIGSNYNYFENIGYFELTRLSSDTSEVSYDYFLNYMLLNGHISLEFAT